MPRVADYIVDCSIYLYRSERDANAGTSGGGSGFLVHVPFQSSKSFIHPYAVTNKHLLDEGFHVLRLTKKSGGFETIHTSRQDWFPHPDGDDVEIYPIGIGGDQKWWSVCTDIFLTRELIHAYKIGIGDEVFLVGRLINHEGKQENAPVARFGNISLMADLDEPIKCEGREQEGFLIECRSLSGFSGSPVFVTTTQSYSGDDADAVAKANRAASLQLETTPPQQSSGLRSKIVSFSGTFGPWLLGINWGHIPLFKPVYASNQRDKAGYCVDANTGIACVLPAWRILEALESDDVLRQRRRDEQAAIRHLAELRATMPDDEKDNSTGII